MLFATLGEHSRLACRRDSIAYVKLFITSIFFLDWGGGCRRGAYQHSIPVPLVVPPFKLGNGVVRNCSIKFVPRVLRHFL